MKIAQFYLIKKLKQGKSLRFRRGNEKNYKIFFPLIIQDMYMTKEFIK